MAPVTIGMLRLLNMMTSPPKIGVPGATVKVWLGSPMYAYSARTDQLPEKAHSDGEPSGVARGRGVADAVKARRCACDRDSRTIRRDPRAAALGVKQHAVPGIAEPAA